MAINKVVYGGEVLLDLTGDNVSEATLLKGATAHNKAGEEITGECDFDSNTSDATAAVAEVLAPKTFYARGKKETGTMPNNGAVAGTISTKAGEYTVPQGYHDGSGKVGIDSAEQAKIIGGNIKQGVTILGVPGTYSGEGVKLQSKTATPSKTQQTIQADSNYDALSSVIVNAIPYVEAANAAGGITVTIA